jgi:hypothetical protein
LLQYIFANKKSESNSIRIERFTIIEHDKGVEKFLLILLRNSNALVLDKDFKVVIILGNNLVCAVYFYHSILRELVGIREQVHEHLLESVQICVNYFGKMIFKFQENLVGLNLRLLVNDLNDWVDRVFSDHSRDRWLKLTF